tara:strand:- start:73 stop:453 length:381 start_codon:yes stop_codon:yes gene_type:complete
MSIKTTGIKALIVSLILLTSSLSYAIELTKADYMKFIVSNYVHGFKEFDTSVIAFDDGSVSVGIYYDITSGSVSRANQLSRRFEKQVPALLSRYDWGKDISLIVSVHGEDRSRGYCSGSFPPCLPL